MKKLLIFILAMGACVACSNNEGGVPNTGEQVSFTSSTIASRTVGDAWEDGDSIGIFMYPNLVTSSPEYANVCYVSNLAGDLTVHEEDEAIYFLLESSVDFYAYYPYQRDMVGTTYVADIADQSDWGAVDFLVATKTDVSKTTDAISLSFEHKLSMLAFEIVPKWNVSSLEGLQISVQDIHTQASYDIRDCSKVGDSSAPADFVLSVSEDAADLSGNVLGATTSSILVLPESIDYDATLLISLDGDGDGQAESFEASLKGLEFTSGKITTVKLTVGYMEADFSSSVLNPWEDYAGNSEEVLDAEAN